MFKNSDGDLIKEIARDHYNCHRTRNRTAIFAVFLTTLLIATVCTAGVGFFSTAKNAGEQAPGPMSDGSIKGGPKQLERILERPEVEWANLVRVCSSLSLRNEEFGGTDTRLYAPDDSFYQDNLVELKTGKYPEQPEEILISDTLAQKLGIPEEAGQPFTLRMAVEGKSPQEGKHLQEEKALPLIICGIYKNPLFTISDIYEEIYASEDFRETYNPFLPADQDIIYVKLNNLNPLLFHADVESRLSDLAEAVDAEGYSAGKYSANMYSVIGFIIPALIMVLLLVASGYFLIFNVFYISVASDIRWFGMMRTIGSTGRQINRIMSRQIRRMTFLGILSGILLGYPVGILAGKRIMDMTDWALYYRNPRFLPAAVLSAVFAILTVRISASRPVRIASGISPVEAARYTPKKKKGIFTVLSLALSGIIFLAVSNVVFGYQVEAYVDRYNQDDYQIFHKASLWYLEESYKPISGQLKEKLQALPFVEKVDAIYMARTSNEQPVYGYYEDSTGEITPEGKLGDYVRSTLPDYNYTGNGVAWLNERGNLKIPIFGMPAGRWSTEQVNYRILEGEYDEEKFAGGDYVIFNGGRIDVMARSNGKEPDRNGAIHAGDELTLTFYDHVTEEYKTRKLTVMMVIEQAHEYSSSDISPALLVLPDTLFQEIYSGYFEMTASLQIRARRTFPEQELTKEQTDQIRRLVWAEHSTQLQTGSRLESYREAYRNQTTYGLLGFFLSGILAVIGIANVVNTITADVFAHRLEYAVMQSVGMTGRQLFVFLFLKTVKLCGAALILTVPAGAALSVMLAENSLFTGFHAGLFVEMLICVAAALTFLVAALSGFLVKNLNRKSLVERIRDTQ